MKDDGKTRTESSEGVPARKCTHFTYDPHPPFIFHAKMENWKKNFLWKQESYGLWHFFNGVVTNSTSRIEAPPTEWKAALVGGVCWRFSAFWGFLSRFPDGDLISFKAFNLNVTKVSKNLSTFISFINNKSVTDKIKQISHSIFCSFHGCNDLFSPLRWQCLARVQYINICNY